MTGQDDTARVPRLYSVAEVCELLQCESEDWLVDRVRSGEFPARRVCRHLRFSVSDIESIIGACAITNDDDVPVPTSRQRRQNPVIGVGGNVRVRRQGNGHVGVS
ncbi:helix-turn-helix domain-containing protein [Mycobacterium paragordonae]|uniref:helix-turn-helix domain-containing protein n=1 Tax=Mycobacterium paragordonae TaxID=1389713 RepID=UPI0018CBF1F2